jgi:hypothetical protein
MEPTSVSREVDGKSQKAQKNVWNEKWKKNSE